MRLVEKSGKENDKASRGKNKRVRVVLDTNVLISGLGWKGGNEYRVLEMCFAGDVEIVFTPVTIEEFRGVALRPRLGFSGEDVEEFITALLKICEFVVPDRHFSVVDEDPDDDAFIDAAIEGECSFIVTGDGHLRSLKEFQGVEIVNAKEFLERID
ncbi:MAG: putative toxin-antitoxin system toxin component, PIN family [Promethearchaeota archaeon]